MKPKWNRRLGISKQEQGVKTPHDANKYISRVSKSGLKLEQKRDLIEEARANNNQ